MDRGSGELGVEIEPEAVEALVNGARGDARIALNGLETAANLAAGTPIELAQVEQALQAKHLLYDKSGDQHYDIVSALIKSIRGGDPDAAVYWMARMIEAGEDLMFVARRLVISAAEDIGLADPQALSVAVAAQQAAHFVGLPEATLPLSEAAVYLARAPKSNTAMKAYGAAVDTSRQTGNLPVPDNLRDEPTRLAQPLVHGREYRHPHDFAGGTVEQQYLPDAIKDHKFYRPGERDVQPDTLES